MKPGCECAAEAGDSLRCHCGSLLARLVDEGVELKCRRCKRTFVIPLSERQKDRATCNRGTRHP